ITISIPILTIITQETEKNTILTAAQLGAQTGAEKNGYAIYYNDTFNYYQESLPELTKPIQIQIVKITPEYGKNKINLTITLTTRNNLNASEKDSTGSRIEYYTREKITKTFNKESESNTFYNPAKSNNYNITTKIKWV
ncbi:MAG: hypothetical protein Q4Q23_04795, partial [Methanobacteriaceae archaeon]|nr:hypothetical protein [Methanobacteriaceae archaeon]